MLLSCCVHVACQNVSRSQRVSGCLGMLLACCCHKTFQLPGVFPGCRACCLHVAVMLRLCCFPKRFQKLVFLPGFFAHVAFMLRPCSFPKRFKNLVFFDVLFERCFHACFFHVASAFLSKSFKNLVCFQVFARVAFMLRPCCFPKRFQNLVFLPGFFAHVCCFHVASMLLSKTLPQPCVCPGFCACCFHVASILFFKNVSRTGCLPRFFGNVAVMLGPCCFPSRFKNLVAVRVFAHVAFMLPPCCLPKRFKKLLISQDWAHFASPRCVHAAFQSVQKPGVFPGFCACCLHVASMLLSKTFQYTGVSQVFAHVAVMLRPCCFPKGFKYLVFLPGFFAHVCFFHVASMLLSKTLPQPCVCPGFCACCFHVASILFFKNVSRTGCLPRFFGNVAFMLGPCCFPSRFKNHLVAVRVFAHVAFMLPPCCLPKRFKKLLISQDWAHFASPRCVHAAFQSVQKPGVFPGFCACCLHVASMLLSKTFQYTGVSQVFAHVAVMLRPCCFPNGFKYLGLVRVLKNLASMFYVKTFQELVLFPVFAHVAFILLPCCFPNCFKILVVPGVCACCLHVVSMARAGKFHVANQNVSIAWLLRVLLSCCVPVAFQNVPRTWCLRRLLCVLLTCCVCVIFQNGSRRWCFSRFLRMLLSCCLHVAVQNVSTTWCLRRFEFTLLPRPRHLGNKPRNPSLDSEGAKTTMAFNPFPETKKRETPRWNRLPLQTAT